MDDEIALDVGDVLSVMDTFEDGWACGFSHRSGMTGFFPFNAVIGVVDGEGNVIRHDEGGTAKTPEELVRAGEISVEEFEVIKASRERVLRGEGARRGSDARRESHGSIGGLASVVE
ncbi:hypothetical protein HK104_006826 [Borealophlyctis nickersoniae]|nr:hypothetical protein HK104_006826 [Borealophlyctis nickersoniae]